MQTQNQFTIKIQEKVFTSNEEGFLDLNEIWRGCQLEEKKRPSEWKSEIKQVLTNSEKIRIKKGRYGTTYATEDATIAYAMFVDKDFYMDVVNSFIDLRNGRVSEAVERAANSMSKSDGDKLKDMVWENINGMKAINQRTALQVAGINNPIIFMRELRKRNTAYRRLIDEEKIVLQTYAPNKWIERFTQEGFQWLLDKSEEMNAWVSEVRVKSKKLI